MRTALRENRAALGIAQAAPGPDEISALGTAAARLRDADRAGAAAALAPGLFEPGGEATLDRLGAPGPLPAAEQSSAALAREASSCCTTHPTGTRECTSCSTTT
jgi:hypothetical protein